MNPQHPYASGDPNALGVLAAVIIPVTALLVLLFNARRMGKRKSPPRPAASGIGGGPAWKRGLVILCGFLLGVLVTVLVRFLL